MALLFYRRLKINTVANSKEANFVTPVESANGKLII